MRLPVAVGLILSLVLLTPMAQAAVPTLNFTAEPTTIALGASTTLRWTSTGATACTASGAWSGSQATSGTRVSKPTAGTKTYTLSCTGSGGSVSSSVSVVVVPPAPELTLSASPTTITLGQSATLSWVSKNATSCTASDAWSGSKPLSGSEVVTPTVVGISGYDLRCRVSGGGRVDRTVAITVNPATAPYGLSSRPVLAPLAFPSQSVQQGEVAITNAFPNLLFQLPLFVTAPPADTGRLFVATQPGLIQVFANDPATTVVKTFLDLRGKVNQSGGELGLLGFAFDPDYSSNGWFYINYNPLGGALRTRISRFRVSANRDVADPASETVLLEFAQPFANHNGGWLGFGPDGKLYIATGDGGDAGDPMANGQNLNVLLGKTLRLNRDGSIPADNPYAGQAGRRGEIWAYGLRNPFRMSFDRATGRLWAADVGQNNYEEVDVISRGGNYGWSVREGRHGYPTADVPKPAGNNFIDPVAEYDHSTGCSISGGYVYRGSAIPALIGQYLFSDFCSSTLLSIPASGEPANPTALAQIPGNPSSFGEDASGEVYITSYDGRIYKLVRGTGTTPGPTFPQKLSQTGLFSNLTNLTPNPGLIEYGVKATFWSDGATKRRWLALPNNGLIGFTADRAWTFPADTVTVKHFEIRLANGRTRRLETRVFVHQADGWAGYTYKWNAAGSDADLLANAEFETLTVAGGATQVYEYPSRSACLNCHNSAAGFVLGIKTQQMNRSQKFPSGVTDNQLRAYNHVGLFDRDIGSSSQYRTLANPADTTTTLSRRARAYLDTNCAQCHQPTGPTPVDMDLRATTAMSATRTLNVPPSGTSLGLPNARRIASGSKESSLIWERMRRLDDNRMPNIASHVVDADGVALIGQWIDSGAP
ncbi:PQQ-dependent sugar dehydrogenase [Nevskia ramosa]|uniref:PQQ-dependent sugar dehydrogenase n=1 Tax=Nevskia ramosa TaxID=64002 RepID=UPI0023561A97|nr:PQQ-dependent sugar dehydrogenase [Nevskia ramosa]